MLIRYKARYVFAWNPISRHELHSSNCQVLLCVPWVSVNMILSVHRHIPQREKTLSDLYFLLVVRRYFSVATRLTCTTMIFLLERKGRFTPWIMTSGHGRWLFSMVRLPWSNFHDLISFTKSVYKVFGSLTRCKPQVNQEEWPCTKKWVCWFNICPNRPFSKKDWKNASLTIVLSSLVFIFSSHPPPNKIYYYNNISLSWALAFFWP